MKKEEGREVIFTEKNKKIAEKRKRRSVRKKRREENEKKNCRQLYFIRLCYKMKGQNGKYFNFDIKNKSIY